MGLRSERRWGEQAPGSENEARERLLVAAEDCFGRYGVSKTTVTDVARAAKVTRPTVYRYFDGRQSLVRGVLMRDAARYADALAREIDAISPLEEAVVHGLLYCLRHLRQEPRFQHLFGPGADGLESLSQSDLLRTARALLAPLFERIAREGRGPGNVPEDARVEWVFRILLSFLHLEGIPGRSDAELRRLMENLLLPVLI